VADRLRVAVIGVGAMGAHHVRVYSELPDADLVAVADANEARLAARDVRAYATYISLLAEEELHAVSVAVPTRLHEEVATACIERGVTTLVEKPLAADVAGAERVRAFAEHAGAPLQVGHIERFNPAVVALKQQLEAGDAGPVLQISARRVGPFFARERDVGVVHDLATHDIDILRYLTGNDVESVRAETQSGIRTEHEDALSAVMRFEAGIVGTLETNWLAPSKTRELRVLCERGEYRLDYITQALTFHDSSREPSEDAPSTGTPIPVETEEPLRAELRAFLAVARGEAQPRVGAHDAIAAMRVVEALIESARSGRPQAVAGPS